MSVEAAYFVPRSQVWEGSRGRQQGRVHLIVGGRTLCGRRRGWYERPPDGETRCLRCADRATQYGVEWPVQHTGKEPS